MVWNGKTKCTSWKGLLTLQDCKVNDMVPKFVYKKTASTMFTKNSINDTQMLARSPSNVDFTELRSLNWSDSVKVCNPACNRAKTMQFYPPLFKPGWRKCKNARTEIFRICSLNCAGKSVHLSWAKTEQQISTAQNRYILTRKTEWRYTFHKQCGFFAMK